MGSAVEMRDRLWVDKLAQALRLGLVIEVEEAEALAKVVLCQGVPPGMNEAGLRTALWSIPESTPAWVEQVMRIVQEVRDGVRSAPQSGPLPLLRSVEPEVTPPVSMPVPASECAPPSQIPEPTLPTADPDLLLPLVLDRLRAVNQFRQVEPQVRGAQTNLRSLRIAVSGEADDSVRLPHLLAEWLAARREWEAQNQVLQSAHATLRTTEWLIQYLQGPSAKH